MSNNSLNFTDFLPPVISAEWLNPVNTAVYANCGTAGGSANAITLISPAYFTAFSPGQPLTFLASHTNTGGAITLAVSTALGNTLVTNLLGANGGNLAAGDVTAGMFYQIIYNGTSFQLSPFFDITVLASPLGSTLVGYEFELSDPAATVAYKLDLTYSPEDAGAVGDGVTDDLAALQAAINYCLANGITELKSRRTFAISGTVDISNFASGFRMELGGLVASAGFPAASNWKTATPMLRVGYTGGSQVGLNVNITFVNGGGIGKADVLFITNNGCGGSRFHFGFVENTNINVKMTGNTTSTASNYITGDYWQNGIQAAHVIGAGGVCEGTMFDVNFITGYEYGGLWAGDRTQYFNVRGQLDFNGRWLSELNVPSITGFAIGDTVTSGSASGEVLATYTFQGATYLLVIETKDVSGGNSNFTPSATISNGTVSTTITSIRTCNQASSAFYFDIISAITSSAPFWRAKIYAAYLGGIVGNLIWDATVNSGNSNSATTNWYNSLEVYNSGTTLSLADKRSSDTSFVDITDTIFGLKRALYMANNPVYGNLVGANIPNGSTVSFFTLPAAPSTGAIWEVTAINPTDPSMRGSAKVYVAFGVSTAVMVVEAQNNITMSVSGLTIQIAQGTGSAKVVNLTATRIL